MKQNQANDSPALERSAESDTGPVLGHRGKRRLAWALLVVLVVVLLVVLPPLISVNRYQRRIAQSISQSIGRPVHFDQIQVHLLPLPGLTIQNFVVQEDPAFGAEPALRANTVQARLRLGSLWRRRVEVSRILLEAPSINLVRLPDGRWNLHGVVAQAGFLQNAPTAQQHSGDAPRFPYVEATSARINIKDGENKLPWSLVDAKLALWLPDPAEWRVRLNGRPLRTDTDVSDVGELQVEGSLGRGPEALNGGVVNQPLALSMRWSSTPLGEAAKLFFGRDTGFRGAASAEVEVRGTPAQMRVSTDLHLHNMRRSEFVPRLPMSVNAHCEAQALNVAHELHNVRCVVPTAASEGLFGGVFRARAEEHATAAPDVLAILADVPNLLDPKTAVVTADLKDAKPEYFLNWLRVFSSRIPENVSASGSVSLHTGWNAAETPGDWTLAATCDCIFWPPFRPATAAAGTGASPTPAGSAVEKPADSTAAWLLQVTHHAGATPVERESSGDVLAVSVARAALQAAGSPAGAAPEVTGPAVVQGQISRSGDSLRYASPDVLRYAASLLPPLSDDMPAAYAAADAPNGPVQSERSWGQTQHWTTFATDKPAEPTRRKHRR